MHTKFWKLVQNCVHLTLFISSKNPDFNVSQREDSDGLWNAFLQLVLYSSGTQKLETQAKREKHKQINSIFKEI